MNMKLYSIPGILCVAFIFVIIGFLPQPVDPLASTPFDTIFVAAMVLMLMVGIPFGAWLPRARVGWMGKFWRVPSQTFLLPRWQVYLCGTSLMGATLGTLALCFVLDYRYGVWFAVLLFPTLAFLISTFKRFSHPNSTEFVQPSWFRHLFRS